MTRPLTDTELQYVRSDQQASALFLAFPESHTIFAAQLDGTPSSLDQVVQIGYRDVTTGAYGDIPEQSTLWVGSSAGLYDLGICRIRKAADATYLYIGETSSINFADGDYLTIVDDFLPWVRVRRNKTVDPITLYMDWDIDFGTQYSAPNPVANLGPDAIINVTDYTISGGSPASIMFDGSGSFVPDLSGLDTWSWGALGSDISVAGGGSTQNPTFSVTAAGTYKIYCDLTATNGKTTRAWRTLVAYDLTHPPVNQFNLTQMPTCDRDNDGGWSFTVRMYDQAAIATVKDRQQVILFARDWYRDQTNIYRSDFTFDAATKTISAAMGLDLFATGATILIQGSAHNDGIYSVATGGNPTALVVGEKLVDEAPGAGIYIYLYQAVQELSLGPIQYRENIICEGWISKESMHYDPNGAYVDFTVQGMAYWLNQETMFMLGIEDKDTSSDDWHKVYHLFWDFGLFAVLYWQTTLCFISDYYPTGDTRPIPAISEQEDSIWAQLKSSAWNNLLATLCCNRYGQLYAFIPPELVPTADRGSIPVVMTVTTNDTELGKLDLSREPQPKTGFLAGAGVQYAWGSSGIGSAKLAYSPGASYKQFGISDVLPQIVVADQAQLNSLNSLYIARGNNTYPNVPLSLAQNNRFIDCAPAQFVYIDRVAGDNPRGVEFAGNVIPNRVTLSFDAKLGFMACQVTGYAETFEDLVVTGSVPAPTPPSTTPTLPAIPLPQYPPVPWLYLPGAGIKGALTINGAWNLLSLGGYSACAMTAFTKDNDGSFADTTYFSIDPVSNKTYVLKDCFYQIVADAIDTLHNGTAGALGMVVVEITINFAAGGSRNLFSQSVIINGSVNYLVDGPLMLQGHVGDFINVVFGGKPIAGVTNEPLGSGSGTGRIQFLVVG